MREKERGKNEESKNIKSEMKKAVKNARFEMLEGTKSMGVGAATIASAGAVVGIANVFSSLIHSVGRGGKHKLI